MPKSLPLSIALAHLRDELRDAHLTADPHLRLNIKEIQLELALELADEVSGKLSANVWKVIAAEANGRDAATHTHRISLKIEPEIVEEDGDTSSYYASTEPLPDKD